MKRVLIAIAALACGTTIAWADCGKVSDCTTASTPFSGTELIYIVQGGVSKKTAIGNLSTFIGAGMTKDAANAVLPGALNNLGLGTANSPQFTGLTLTGSFTATGLVTNADLAGSIPASKLVGTDIVTVGTLTAGAINWSGNITAGIGSFTDTRSTAITTDGAGALEAFSNKSNGITGFQIWQCMNFACGTGSGGIYSTFDTVTIVPASSTINGVGGITVYARVDSGRTSPLYLGTVFAGYYSDVAANADGAGVWGADFACSDSYGQVPVGGGGHTFAARFCFNEIDMNINSVNSQATAWLLAGNDTAQPASQVGVTLARADGFPGTGNTAHWTSFLLSNDSSTGNFATIGSQYNGATFTGSIAATSLTATSVTGIINIGATLNGSGVTVGTTITAGPVAGGAGTYTVSASQTVSSTAMATSSASQSIIYHAYNSSGAQIVTTVNMDGAGDFNINGPSGGAIRLGLNGIYYELLTAASDFLSVPIILNGGGAITVPDGDSVFAGIPSSAGFGGSSGGIMFVNAANGFIMEGKGSVNDVAIENKNNTIVCDIGTGLTSWNCINFITAGNTTSATLTLSGIPTSAGGGGLFVCVDTLGVTYKKATCP